MQWSDFYINGVPVSDLGVRLLADWSVQDTDPDITVLNTPKGTSLIAFGDTTGLKTLTLPVHIFGENRKKVRAARSLLTSLLSDGIVELDMPDGFMYRVALKSSEALLDYLPDGRKASCSYTMYGLQCEHKVTLNEISDHFLVRGTAPNIDCRISTKVTKAAPSYSMAGVSWSNVKAGDALVLDGIEKRLIRNGYNDALGCNAASWPKLKPGVNTISCPDPVTVEYYPTYL